MEIQKFTALRPYLYHLTDEQNIPVILEGQQLWSTARLARYAEVPKVNLFLRTRRIGHREISNGTFKAKLRDQDPLSQKIVEKNLEGGWDFGDFVYSLNSRVFFWCKESDLRIHYGRYEKQNEFPKILRFNTSDIFEANKSQPEFCRLNSGAPRCSSYYTQRAPPRGPNTFQDYLKYPGTPSSIREVTFLDKCQLPDMFWLSDHPDKKFKKIDTGGVQI